MAKKADADSDMAPAEPLVQVPAKLLDRALEEYRRVRNVLISTSDQYFLSRADSHASC